MDDEEYEVEGVSQARVVKKSKTSKQLIWQYRVRWKGFERKDDTWEPIASFDGSEDILDKFWQRANTGGRDINDLSLFRENEIFYATRPPPKLGKPLPKKTDAPSANSRKAASSSKRNRSPSIEEIEPPPKRARPRTASKQAAALASTRGRKKKPSSPPPTASSSHSATVVRLMSPPEVVPDSEEEEDLRKQAKPATADDVDSLDIISTHGLPVATPTRPIASTSNSHAGPSTIPAHRGRAANSRVKRVESETVDAGKACVYNASKSAVPTKKPKIGPASKMKSSLLTFTKDGPKSIPGKYSAPLRVATDDAEMPSVDEPSVPPPPPPVPTGDELLNLAGLDPNAAKELEDFEEEEVQPTVTAPERPSVAPPLTTSSLFPPSANDPAAAVRPGLWKRSTIFGPLGLASESLPSKLENSSQPPTFVHVDTTLVPVHVVDIHPATASSQFTTDKKGPPGTFFEKDKAQQVINTLRTGGPSGRIVQSSDATDEQKTQFQKLRDKLCDERLFMLPIERDVLAICSSGSALVCQRLNIPQSLLVGGENLLVTRVSIENFMAYYTIVA